MMDNLNKALNFTQRIIFADMSVILLRFPFHLIPGKSLLQHSDKWQVS